MQLALLLRVFPRSQIHVVVLEDLSSAEAVRAHMRHVFHFLGAEPFDVVDTSPKNSRAYDTMAAATQARLQAFFAPHNKVLARMLGRELPWRY